MLTRRNALKAMLGTAATLTRFSGALADAPIVLRHGAEPPVEIPEDFIGLGYEMSSVARPGLLSAANRGYVALVKALGARGIMRVGGIVADYTRYEARGVLAAEPHNTIMTEAGVRQFSGFLEAIGWRAIWSLNFAQGSLGDAVVEARAVAAALGPRLLALELGNEVENYGRGTHPFRPSTWDYAAYRAEYRAWHAAIRQAVPAARFAAPDTASSVAWVESMAADARGDVQLLTTHYYRTDQHHGNAQQLLTPDPRLPAVLARLAAVSKQSGIPWRMCETNSFSGGGLPGVSDSLTGALWTLDYMLLLAQAGCSGVNLETGVNQLGFLSCYSPIRDDNQANASAGPSYYAMLAFAEARRGCTQMLPAGAPLQGTTLTAYVLGRAGRPRSAVLVNRDGAGEFVVSLHELGMQAFTVRRLAASAAGTQSGVTLAASSTVRDGLIRIPAMSAVVVRAENPRQEPHAFRSDRTTPIAG